tara:strand:- start:554 stop:760 length:207 start_codon:yes stop_codon:yes gene_type:complete
MKYNHMFDVAFSIESDEGDGYEIPSELLIKGLEERIKNLKGSPFQASEAFGLIDTYSNSPERTRSRFT